METKHCPLCEQDKPLDEFGNKQFASGTIGKQYACKLCRKAYRDAHYKANKKDYATRRKERRLAFQQWFKDFKSTLKCERCPENHIACLEFHHRDPEQKDFMLSGAANVGYSKETILAEVAKCIVLCANCHRKEHHANGARGDGH